MCHSIDHATGDHIYTTRLCKAQRKSGAGLVTLCRRGNCDIEGVEHEDASMMCMGEYADRLVCLGPDIRSLPRIFDDLERQKPGIYLSILK